MAKIVVNDHAPDEEVTYSVPGDEFTLSPGGSHETDNREVLIEAEAHPWLAVEYDEAEEAVPAWRGDSLSPEDDVLASERSEAFDPEAVERDREAVLGDGTFDGGTAIESGLDQGEPVFSGNVATTFAADDADDEEAVE